MPRISRIVNGENAEQKLSELMCIVGKFHIITLGVIYLGFLCIGKEFIGLWMGAKIFKFHPAINLGCCAGGRTTTAALGAIQDSLDSTIPAMGYTVTYAVGNTLLILWGVAIVLLMV